MLCRFTRFPTLAILKLGVRRCVPLSATAIHLCRMDRFAAKKKQMAKALIESSYFHASYAERLDCHGASAPRNDGVKFFVALTPSLRAERSNPGATKSSARFIQAGRPKAGAKLASKIIA